MSTTAPAPIIPQIFFCVSFKPVSPFRRGAPLLLSQIFAFDLEFPLQVSGGFARARIEKSRGEQFEMGFIHWIQQDGMGLFWAVVIFALMVFIHEFGHFCMAKLTGVKVLEFALGFGNRIIGKKVGDTEYAVRLFPLGGYVKMLGEGEEGDANDPGNFQNKRIGQKIAIVAAGPIMNYILAIFLLLVLGACFGVNTYVFRIAKTIPNMPAAKAGIQAGDKILAVNGQPYSSYYDPEQVVDGVVKQIQQSAGKPLHITVDRNGRTLNIDATPVLDKNEKVGLLGIYPGYEIEFRKTSFASALTNSFLSTWYFTKAPFIEIGKIFQGKQKASELAKGSAGPVGIANIIVTLYNRHKNNGEGFQYLIWIAALLNIFIGLFNLFPIPALDGSRIFFLGLGAAFGKQLNPKLEEGIHLVGFAFLLLLMVLITYQDIWRIVTHSGF